MAKQNPEWRITAFGRNAIPQRKIDAFAIADILADVISGRPSSWGGVLTRSATGNQWSDWGRLGADLTMTNVGFARFLPSGEVTYSPAIKARSVSGATGGFFALPNIAPLRVAGNVGELASQNPVGSASALKWNVLSGAFAHVSAPGTLRPSGLLNTDDLAASSMAQIDTIWPRGAGLHAGIETLGTRSTSARGAIYLQVSPTVRMAFRQHQSPVLERQVITRNGQTATTSWDVWRMMDEIEPCRLNGEYYDAALFLLGGRAVWQVNDRALWLLDGEDQEELPAGAAAAEFVKTADMAALIGGAPLRLEATNLRARLDVARRESADEDGNQILGYVTRTVTRSSARGQMLEPYGVGNLPPGTSLPATVEENGRDVTYTVALTPSEDGLSTPFLTQVYLAYKPVWSTPILSDSLDISDIVSRATVSHAHPPVQSGTEGSVTVDLAMMESQLPTAAAYLQDYNPVQIEGRWDGGPWRGLTKGYFIGVSGEQREYNSGTLTITVQGPMMRLKKLASIVDGQCVPCEYWFHRRLAALDAASQAAAENNFTITRDENGRIVNAKPVPSRNYNYYGADAVQDIIAQFLGPAAAAALNGNGDARRYLPSGRPPFLSYTDMAGSWLAVSESYGHTLTAGSLKAQRGGLLMPPFGQDALTWINQFAADEFCIFTEGYADRDARGWPDLLYGTREEILATAKLHEISGADVEKLVSLAASYETKPEKDVNRILVWGNPWGAEIPLSPAFVQGEARFRPSHPRSAEQTWPRTHIVETPLAATPARAQALASIILMEADGAQFVYPKYTILGDADCMTGDVFTASNVGLLGYEDIWFRADGVEHEYTKDETGRSWTTGLPLRTMSASEIYKFQRTWF